MPYPIFKCCAFIKFQKILENSFSVPFPRTITFLQFQRRYHHHVFLLVNWYLVVRIALHTNTPNILSCMITELLYFLIAIIIITFLLLVCIQLYLEYFAAVPIMLCTIVPSSLVRSTHNLLIFLQLFTTTQNSFLCLCSNSSATPYSILPYLEKQHI
jgi:hypothetical protein